MPQVPLSIQIVTRQISMKNVLLFLPILLSLAMFAAHFLRYGNFLLVAAILGLAALLLVRRPWVARLTQFVLAVAAVEWLRTLAMLVQARAAVGEPYLRLAIILGVVAALAMVAALLFQTKALKAIYRFDD